jgi:hypothetical protein
MLRQVWSELSFILLKNVKIEHFISEMTHKSNALRFWLKVWCLTHLYSYFESNVEDLLAALVTQQ